MVDDPFALASNLRFALTLAVQCAVVAFVIAKLVKTRRRRVLAILALLLAVLGELAVFDVFIAEPIWNSSYVHYQAADTLGRDFGYARYETASPWLGYSRLRIVVLGRHCGSLTIDDIRDAATVTLGPKTNPESKRLRGRGRIFVVMGAAQEVFESDSPVFEELFSGSGGFMGVLTRLKTDERVRMDPALRRFFELDH